MSSDGLDLKWVLVASVPDKSIVPKLNEFGEWFFTELTKLSHQRGVQVTFAAKSLMSYHAKVDDAASIANIYHDIHVKYPDAPVVLHILPGPDTPEYYWMKTMAEKYSLIRQGVQLENALTRFGGVDTKLDEVLSNVLQWIVRRSSEITNNKKPGDRTINLRIGESFMPGQQNKLNVKVHGNTDDMTKATAAVLHNSEEAVIPSNALMSTVTVEGLPHGLNEYQIAAIFGKLHVTQVLVAESTAKVTFANKFHAFNACKLYNGHVYDKYRTLQVNPVHEEVKQKLTLY